ncbi:MAG: hypothetical protein QW045_01735 [Candidatus Micrarchaeaceae archaeon]
MKLNVTPTNIIGIIYKNIRNGDEEAERPSAVANPGLALLMPYMPPIKVMENANTRTASAIIKFLSSCKVVLFCLYIATL